MCREVHTQFEVRTSILCLVVACKANNGDLTCLNCDMMNSGHSAKVTCTCRIIHTQPYHTAEGNIAKLY